eukprot:5575229-Lingulodinium_polyedra.AAC.1
MATLPKPSGGERCVVLQTTFHVLWSMLRAAPAMVFDRAKAGFWDSDVKGSSALGAGLRRRLLQELCVLEGNTSLAIYWDVEKFYD